MPNHSPVIISPFEGRRALRSQLDAAVSAILLADKQELAGPAHGNLIDELTEAVLFAMPGFDMSGAAALDQTLHVAANAEISDAEPTKQQSAEVARRLTSGARTVAARVQKAPWRPIQERRSKAGRPLDVWKGALLGDVERALRKAGVRRCYWATEQQSPNVLQEIYRACATAAGEPMPGDLRNVQRRKFRP